jgi:hypothetical protein
MKRVTVAVLLAVVLAAAALGTATVSLAAGESGPKCADLVSANFNYDDNGDGTYTFAAELLLVQGVAACKQITYTLTLGDVSPNSIVLSGKGITQFGPTTFADTDNQICISATTASGGGHVHDRGPDAGCVSLTAGPVGGNIGMG